MRNKLLKFSSYICVIVMLLGSIITTVLLANNISFAKNDNENNENLLEIESENKKYPLAKDNNVYYWVNISQYLNTNDNEIIDLLDNNNYYADNSKLTFKYINSDNLNKIIKKTILKHNYFYKYPKNFSYVFYYNLSKDKKTININLEINTNKKINNKKVIYFDQFQIKLK